MSKVIVTKIDYCQNCPHLNSFMEKGNKNSSVTFICEAMNSKILGKYEVVKNLKPKILIPNWCPLEDLDPKFEDV